MGFTLGEIATLGLPVGEYVVRVDDIENSINSDKTGETMVFKVQVAQTENPKVKVGAKHVWSYTYGIEWRSIICNDLIRAGLPKDLYLEGNAKADALTLNSTMRGQFYVIRIVEQKKDPTRFNTSFLRPYAGAAAPAMTAAAPAVAAPVSAAAIAPVGPPPPVAVAPPGPASVPTFTPPTAVAPALVAPVAAVAPELEPINAQLIQAITAAEAGQGAYPALNARQIAQLDEIGFNTVSAKYRAAAAPAAVAPPPAAVAFQAV